MRHLALAIAVAALAIGALAQPPKPKKPVDKTPTELHCAVMIRNKLNVKYATKYHMYFDYKGRRYFFCCKGCPERFQANPERFAKKADSIATPKERTKEYKPDPRIGPA